MTLWNIIRDFFVRYIFGGMDSLSDYYASNLVGSGVYYNTSDQVSAGQPISMTDGLTFYIGDTFFYDNDCVCPTYISMGDWLSTTATIITLVGIMILLVLLVRWLFKIGANLIGVR